MSNLLEKKKNEPTAHDAAKPPLAAKPGADPSSDPEIARVAGAIDEAKARLVTKEEQIQTAKHRQATVVQLIATADRLAGRLDNLNRQIDACVAESMGDVASLGLTLEQVLDAKVHTTPVSDKRKDLCANGSKSD